MKQRRQLLTALMFVLTLGVFADENRLSGGTALDFSLAELSSVYFYSASRFDEEKERVPAVVTVIPKEQIERESLKTLNEVLKRVPGFFMENANAFTPFVVHRGLRNNMNVAVLVMVDGIPQNFYSVYGIDNMHMFPTLNHVEQIEIVRGSSSTLWGSDAATAAINIITKDGSTIDREGKPGGSLITNFDYEIENKRRTANMIWGKRIGDTGDVMLSYTYSDEDGYPMPDWRPAWMGPDPSGNWWKPHNVVLGVHDVYFKSSLEDYTVKIGYSQLETGDGVLTSVAAARRGDVLSRLARRSWIDFAHHDEINNVLTNETHTYFAAREIRASWAAWKELVFGFEDILRYSGDSWRGLLGVSYQGIEFDRPPRYGEYKDPWNGNEHIISVFSDASYDITSDLRMSAGCRLEESDLRSEGLSIIPQASAAYGLSEIWTAKYCFSTGIVRPHREFNISDDGWYYDVANDRYISGTHTPMEIRTHEIQFSFDPEPASHAALALFHVTADNFAGILYREIPDSEKPDPTDSYIVWYGTRDTITSYGLELEAEHEFSDRWQVYGNATYQRGKSNSNHVYADESPSEFYDPGNTFYDPESGLTTAMPTYLWNLGVNYNISSKVCINTHYRGAANYYTRGPGITRGKGPDMHFMDLSVMYREILSNTNVSFYIKNVFDQRYEEHIFASNPMRQIGVSLSWQF